MLYGFVDFVWFNTVSVLFSALMKGIESHKKIDLSGNPILKYYYTDRVSSLF